MSWSTMGCFAPCGNAACVNGCLKQLGYHNPKPHGCICPPTSERTCQGPFCPRRPATNPYAKANTGPPAVATS